MKAGLQMIISGGIPEMRALAQQAAKHIHSPTDPRGWVALQALIAGEARGYKMHLRGTQQTAVLKGM